MKYNHAFDIAFSIVNESEEGVVTPAEIRHALVCRLHNTPNDELVESVGAPFDTFEEDAAIPFTIEPELLRYMYPKA
jgi:cystathionine beta-lyase family protein involved in aluminum resistance|tara:strand:- start:918 stop:1148 length:231 start_codon:yes stop_codon:yes gene_type:complete